MSRPVDFQHSETVEPHRARTKKILKEHPEIKKLIGKNPYSFLIITGLVIFMYALAWLLRAQPWWLVFVAAYVIGAFTSHALFVLIHESIHNLFFKKKVYNTLSGILANLPQTIPSSISFKRYHIKHHTFQGVYELDTDLPSKWEAKLINNYFFGKAMWMLFYPLFQIFRLARIREIKPIDGWILFNWGAVFAADALVIYFFGMKSFVFLLASLFFSIGLHPLGARWIQEHYLTSGKQETHSYYGILNIPAMNVGYHNEHHDFPSVPWNNLPKIRSIASEHYDNISYHMSWTKLLFRFLFDKEISLYSRMVRKERGAVSFNDESIPDIELTRTEKKTEFVS
ncbi:MAG: fatty acid desaturase [Bacteroidia bacterium]